MEALSREIWLMVLYLILKHYGQAGFLQMFSRLWDLSLLVLVMMATTSLRVLLSHVMQ